MITAEIDPKDILWLENIGTKLDAKFLLEGEWEPFLTRVVDVAGKYPPDFPGNTYVRTFRLLGSWEQEVLTPLSARIGNAALSAGYPSEYYGRSVHGHPNEQLPLHVTHGWKSLFTVGSKHLDFLAQKLWEKIERIWTQ